MSYLVLVRHGESEWNQKGLWTGWTDIPLTEHGHEQAREAGNNLTDINFDIAFTSTLSRAKQTLDEIKQVLHQNIPTTEAAELKERDYGDLTGKNKWDIEKQYGTEQFMKWRRSWDSPVPGGETLKDVYNRVLPYYYSEIEPRLREEKNVLITAHGNSLRALIKYLENISDEDIPNLELATGEAYVYTLDSNAKVLSKKIRKHETHNKHGDIH